MMHQSKPWKHQGFLPPKKAKTVMSAGKVITCSTTLKKNRTITRAGANYTEPISRDKKNALPLHNAPVYTLYIHSDIWLLSKNVDSNLLNTHLILLTAPSDYYFFLIMQKVAWWLSFWLRR